MDGSRGELMRAGRWLALFALIVWPVLATGQNSAARSITISATEAATLRQWDSAVDRMIRSSELQVAHTEEDTLVPGRTHERLTQVYQGVPVYGGGLTRQTSGGLTVSLFGTMYTNIAVNATPKLTREDAAAVIKSTAGVELGEPRMPELLILPEDSGYRVAYHATAFSLNGANEYFIDANTGAIVRTLNAVDFQAPVVGSGTGVLGETEKMSVIASSGTFASIDSLRPAKLATLDMRGSLQRTVDILNSTSSPAPSDVLTDSDNVWTDGAAVSAHVNAGFTYDYYYKRFGRHGFDNHDIAQVNLVHPVTRADALTAPPPVFNMLVVNAFYAGGGVTVFGDGLPPNATFGGQHWNYLSGALDAVAHESSHGVTEATWRPIHENESGALAESFSDMMATAVEFFFQPPGTGPLHADYLIAEDVVTPGGLRSMDNPQSLGQPDHYSRLVITSDDNGGIHVNCGIGNQAYYLAIEGGTNRTSGMSVQGVGAANREQIERVMYRAFTQLLPSNATYSMARSATIQAARDLYGAGSAVERAITQAWTAVGVN
jgi:Zn-dependent metalloprotease